MISIFTFLIDELGTVRTVLLSVCRPVCYTPVRYRGIVVAAEDESVAEENLEAEAVHKEEDVTETQEEEE